MTAERKQLIYIKLIIQGFLESNSTSSIRKFTHNVLTAKLPDDVKAIVCSALFAHACFLDTLEIWNLTISFTRQLASNLVKNLVDATEDELLQALFRRYATIFTRAFLHRLFLESAAENEIFDELKIRELAQFLVTQIAIFFKFSNLNAAISTIRPSLFYYSIISGARGIHAEHVCSVIDFIYQELTATTPTSIPKNPSDMKVILSQRKALCTELFPKIVQFLQFEEGEEERNELFWKFCKEQCDFNEENLNAVTATFRKQVFENLLLVAPQVLCDIQEDSRIPLQLQKTYEIMKKGESFTIATAMDTRNEGIEIIFTFRSYFTEDAYFMMRDSAAASFSVVLQNLKPVSLTRTGGRF